VPRPVAVHPYRGSVFNLDAASPLTCSSAARGDAVRTRLLASAGQEPRVPQWRREYVRAVAMMQEDLAFPGAKASSTRP